MTISPLGKPSFTIEGPYDAGGPHSLLWDGRDEGGNILTGVIGVTVLAEATLQPNSVIVLIVTWILSVAWLPAASVTVSRKV